MVRKFVALALASTVAALMILLYSRGAFTQNPSGELITLTILAQEAAAAGRTEAYFEENESFEGVDDLETALSQYSVVVAVPVSQQSYAVGNVSIVTWYKFQVQEVLTRRAYVQCSFCSPLPNAPAEVQPTNANEIAVLRTGGAQVVQGVTVFSTTEFPDFTLHQKYLLFLNWDEARNVARIRVGPPGVYLVDAYNRLATILPESEPGENPIADGLAAQYGNNLNQLRNALNPPPGCDPAAEQNCYYQGGSWDFSTCTCQYYNPCEGGPWLCY